MDTRIAPNQQAEQLLNTLMQIRVPSRNFEDDPKELKEILGMIGLLSDMDPNVKNYFIQSGKDMIISTTNEEDRNRAFVLLCVYAHEHNQLVDTLITILNHYSVIDDCNKEIENGTATGKTYISRGVSSYYLQHYVQAQQDLETAVKLGELKAKEILAEMNTKLGQRSAAGTSQVEQEGGLMNKAKQFVGKVFRK